MLIDAIGGLLPAALAVALSPVPVIAVVLVLGSPRARTIGPAFAAGWVIGLAAVSALVIGVLGAADGDSSGTPDTGIAWGRTALGLLMLALAAKEWIGRSGGAGDEPGDEPALPAWITNVDHLEPPKAFVLGLGLSAANPKNLALTLSAAASIAQVGLSATHEVMAVVAFVAIGSLTVAGTVLAALVAPSAMAQPLDALKQFMTAHGSAIMIVVLLLLGAKLVGDGLAGI